MHDHLQFRLDDNDHQSVTEPTRGIYVVTAKLGVIGLEKSDTLAIGFSSPDVSQSIRGEALNTGIGSVPGALTKTGFQISQADDEGGVHQDLEFVLVDTEGLDVKPESGVYLFGLEMTTTGFADAAPTYFVLGSGIEESVHELAVDYVATTFAVPEASTGAYSRFGLLILLAWRRRSSEFLTCVFRSC